MWSSKFHEIKSCYGIIYVNALNALSLTKWPISPKNLEYLNWPETNCWRSPICKTKFNMASPNKINTENIERKMQGVSNTQDSIQSLSLWAIHHKSDAKQIVDVWLKVVKRGTTIRHWLCLLICWCQNGHLFINVVVVLDVTWPVLTLTQHVIYVESNQSECLPNINYVLTFNFKTGPWLDSWITMI